MEGWAVLRGACLDDELGGVGFNFWSEVEVGTELQLTVPGAIAYKVSVRGMDSGGFASRKFPKHRCCTDRIQKLWPAVRDVGSIAHPRGGFDEDCHSGRPRN